MKESIGLMNSTLIRQDGPDVPRSMGLTAPSVSLASLWQTLNGRYFLLLAIGLVYQLTYQHTRWLQQEDALAVPIVVVPVPGAAWYSVFWLTTVTLVLTLVGKRGAVRFPDSDLTIRRTSVIALAVVYYAEVAVRSQSVGFWGLSDLESSPAFLLSLGALMVVTALMVWRPPTTNVLLTLMVVGGILLRLFLLSATHMDENYADNLPAVVASLDLLLAGHTPYVVHEFATHLSDMHYFPWTLLSYLPVYLTGWDIRLTNVALTLAMAAVMWKVISSLDLHAAARSALLLALGVFLMLPKPIGHDAYNEFQMFNLAVVATFALIIFRRTLPAAAAYGVALGSMPLAAYFALPLLAFATRAYSRAELLRTVTVAFLVAAVPIGFFLAWDPRQFISTVLVMPGPAFGAVLPVPYRAAWHLVFEGKYLLVLAAISLVVGWLAFTRIRTVYGVIGLAAAGYLSLIIFGPYVVSHLTTVVLCLVLMAEAVYLASGPLAGQRGQNVQQ